MHLLKACNSSHFDLISITSLDNVSLPRNLQQLTFGYCFNQSLDNVRLLGA